MICNDRQHSGDAELIKWAVYYTNEKLSKIWTATWDALLDPKTWDAFKEAIAEIYPKAQLDHRHTIAALYTISNHFSAHSVTSETALAKYHREFSRTAQYLIRKHHMTRREASIMYMSAFPPELRPDITTRLTIKYPDIHPDDGYDLKDMNSATQFIISSRSAIALLAAMMPQPPTPPMPAPPSPPSTAPTPSTASAQPLSVTNLLTSA